jgi:hypothetical protein
MKSTAKAFCSFLFLLLFVGCTPSEKGADDVIHIHLKASYPEIEINVKDFATVEYVQLDLHDDFFFNSFPSVVASDIFVLSDRNGNVFSFTRDGKPVSKFNKRGGGQDEYPEMTGIVYDEQKKEIFIQSHERINVYSLNGELQRILPLLQGSFVKLAENDNESLIIFDYHKVYPTPFSVISKENGEVIEMIDIPYGNQVNMTVILPPGGQFRTSTTSMMPIFPYRDGNLLNSYSTDTIYLYNNRILTPFLTRTPGLHAREPAIVIETFTEAGNFQFLQTVPLDGEFVRNELIRDKRTGNLYRQKIILDDFKGKEIVLSTRQIKQNSKIGIIDLDLTELQDANREGKLSGRLKGLVDNSEEDGNDIYMLLHFK